MANEIKSQRLTTRAEGKRELISCAPAVKLKKWSREGANQISQRRKGGEKQGEKDGGYHWARAGVHGLSEPNKR